jgi:hypothetical protein
MLCKLMSLLVYSGSGFELAIELIRGDAGIVPPVSVYNASHKGLRNDSKRTGPQETTRLTRGDLHHGIPGQIGLTMKPSFNPRRY